MQHRINEFGVFVISLPYLRPDKTHGPYIGQFKRAHDGYQAIASQLLIEIHGHFARIRQ